MSGRIVLCGNGCGHDHNSANGPSGCCTRNPEHGPYLYFCRPCHDEWAAANPERVAEIRRIARHATPPGEVTR
jgi:hypothetical protein